MSIMSLSLEFVKRAFEDEGYILLSDFYINNRQDLDFICPNGHTNTIRWTNWQQGSRCSNCAFDRQKIGIDKVRVKMALEGYTLLTKAYKNAHQKLKYKCPVGHVNYTQWNGWNTGYRCNTCDKIKHSGPGHWNWKGGISCEPYCSDWTKEYKEYIKERDDYVCQNPDCWKTSGELNVHHINYIKKDCCPANLITLCRSCNVRANYKRNWHTSFYTRIIEEKYNKGKGIQ